MKKDAFDVFTQKRKSQFDIVEKQRIAPERKTCWLRCGAAWNHGRAGIARSRLIEGEGTQ